MSTDQPHPELLSDSPASTPLGSKSPPPQIIIQERTSMFGRFGKLLLIALGIAIMTIMGMAASYQSYFNPPTGPQEKYHSLSKTATKKIAIISAVGAIMEGDGFIKQQIDRIRQDDDVVGVVLRVNSPGGTVTGSDFIYHHLQELVEDRELPLVASMGSICASGGYYIAMAVGEEPDTVFAEPTTWTGSIGVVIPHYDLSGLLTTLSISEDSITSGPLKRMGSPTKRMTERERAVLQELVDESFEGFKQIVRNGRPEFIDDPEALDAIATGQIFTANQALEKGLVDKIGFIDAAIERVAELAEYDLDDLRCVKYGKPQSAVDAILNGQSPTLSRPHSNLAALLDLATPRAYYLYSWLPTILTNSQQ